MTRTAGLHIICDEATSLAAALMLHFMVLYCMWNYHATPPQAEAKAVFVSLITPLTPARKMEQVVSEAVSKKQAAPIKAPPVLPKLMASATPATSPAQTVSVPVHSSKVQATPAPGNVTATPITAGIAPPNSGSASLPQPLLLGGELSVNCSERTAPAYPKQSLRFGEQGKTVLLVELDELGQMINVEVKIKSGFPRLDEAAVNAVKTWRCTPAKRNGVAVRSIALQPFNFSLKGR